MGRDLKHYSKDMWQGISTHTPAWGATGKKYSEGLNSQISTHTPAWGATTSGKLTRGTIRHFNSHARVGRDGSKKN